MALITQDYFNKNMTTLGLRQDLVVDSEALDTLIQEASDWVEGYCDRKFAVTEYTELINYPFRSKLPMITVDNWPLIEVVSIAWEDENQMSGTYSPTLLWTESAGTLRWKNPRFFAWFGTLRYTIVYRAGYETIPSNVQRATALKVANLMQPQYQGVQDREVFMVSNIETMIVDLLEPFRRERLG